MPPETLFYLISFLIAQAEEMSILFGEGICAHIAFGEPISHQLRELIFETASSMHKGTVHNGGTYVNMDGPAFSTRAESLTNQRLGFDIIGMTICLKPSA